MDFVLFKYYEKTLYETATKTVRRHERKAKLNETPSLSSKLCPANWIIFHIGG